MGGLGKVGNERSESKRLLIDCPSYLSSCAGHDVGLKGLRDSGSTVPCGATRRSSAEKKLLEGRLMRQPSLPKWSVTIAPPKPDEIILPA